MAKKHEDISVIVSEVPYRMVRSEEEKSHPPLVIASEAKQSHNTKIKEKVEKIKKETELFLDDFKFNEALSSIWNLVHLADNYIEEKKPWEKKEESKEVIEDVLFIICELSELIFPFLPETAEKIKKQLQNKEKETLFPKIK
jgi:methionyl-tRNA synthetase